MAEIRVAIRVRPGSSRTRVGGRYGEDTRLVVAVTAPPVDGAANDAVIDAVAKALAVPSRRISVLSGHTARSKVLALTVDDDDEARVRGLIDDLLGDGSR